MGRHNRIGEKAVNAEAIKRNFEKSIEKTKYTSCWKWKGVITRQGYGILHLGNDRYIKAHRYSYELYKKPIEPGLVIDHICRNKACVNPEHLREVTTRINSIENSHSASAVNIIKTHCIRGHEFTEENTYLRFRKGKPNRKCRECIRNYHKEYHKKHYVKKQKCN